MIAAVETELPDVGQCLDLRTSEVLTIVGSVWYNEADMEALDEIARDNRALANRGQNMNASAG